MKLLLLLAEKAMESNEFVHHREIEQHLWADNLSKMNRTVRDVIRDLREILAGEVSNKEWVKQLVETGHALGYRLALQPTEIELIH